MNEAGYTLTETLAALAILGLAMSGLTYGLQVIGRLQLETGKAVMKDQEMRAAQQLIDGLLADGAPFRSHQPEGFSGTTQGFRFACGRPEPCEVTLVAHGGVERLQIQAQSGRPLEIAIGSGTARFVYQGSATAATTWPPDEPGRQYLKAVSLVRASTRGEQVILASRLWREQPGQCAYDPVLRDCR